MPSYQVTVTAYQTVVVHDVADEDEAAQVAFEEVSRGDFEIDDTVVDCELKTQEDIERAERHFNTV